MTATRTDTAWTAKRAHGAANPDAPGRGPGPTADHRPRRGAGPPALAVLFALSAGIALLGGVTDINTLRILGAYGVIMFGIGAAPLQLVAGIDLWARLGIAALIGLTVQFGVGALIADVRPLWHPATAAVVLVGIAAALHLVALRRRPLVLARRPRLDRARARDLSVDPTFRAALLAVSGTAVWLGAALGTGHVDPGIGGLLTRIDPAWYVGLALVAGSIVVAGDDERLLAFAVLSLALAVSLTPALLYGAPRTQSAAKHIELVNFILRTHHIVPGAGIFQAYSAFFAGNAWLTQVTGASNVFGLATFWPVVIAPVWVAEMRFFTSRTLSSARIGWIAVALVVLVDSLGDDYFSPQSLGYVMVLGIFGLVVRGVNRRPLNTGSTAFVLVLASLTLAISHELSPFVAAGALLVLAVFRQAPVWAAVVVGLPAAEWASIEHRVLGSAVNISHAFSPTNFAPPKTQTTAGLARLPVVGLSSGALLIGLLALMLAAGVALCRYRRSRWAWAYAICPAVGLSFIALNSYGNEGIFRAVLFAIPWLAILAMHSVDGGPIRRPAWLSRLVRLRGAAPAALLATFLVLIATFTVGAYAMDGGGVLRPSEMSALHVFLARAPKDSLIVPLGWGDSPATAPGFGVAKQTAGRSGVAALLWQQVAPASARSDLTPGPAQLASVQASFRAIATKYHARRTARLYLLWSRPLSLYSQEYGEQSAGQSRAWLELLRSSPHWRVAYHHGDTYLFSFQTKITPPGSA